MAAAFCVLAMTGSLCAAAAPSAPGKSKPPVAQKGASGKENAIVLAKRKKRSASKSRKSKVATKSQPLPAPEPRTPTDKHECIAIAQAFYRDAGSRARRAKKSIPDGFIRVVSRLDELCGEEEFDKARISIDWMHTCLEDLSKGQKAGVCSSDDNLVCAVATQNTCTSRGRVAEQ
jgi:hypothetical protein